MELPKITWHILDHNEYTQESDYYLGSFNSGALIQLQIQVWNNRYGTKLVQDIENARLNIYFENAEDSILLNYCEVSIDDLTEVKPEVTAEQGTIEIGKLYGYTNNGVSNEANRFNYKNIRLEFKNLPTNLKNGMKNMFLDISMN